MLFILDRDGVINQDPGYINNPNDWHAFPGSLKAIAFLKDNGHHVVVASNQSGIGRGLITEAELAQVHQKMQRQLQTLGAQLDDIFYCPHHPDDHCHCRKPNTGLLEQITQAYPTPRDQCWFIGDSLCDIQAGTNFGCHVALVLTGHGRKTSKKLVAGHGIPIFDDLAAAANYLCDTP